MIKNLRYYRELHKMTRKELAEMFGLTEKSSIIMKERLVKVNLNLMLSQS